MASESRPDLETLNVALGASGQSIKIALVPIADLELLEKNARYMKSETFRNLVANVKRDGALSSLPFCWKHGDPPKYRVLSGNHRVMAAKEAGLSEVLVLFTDRSLSREEQVAIQLSHNALVGEDDPVLLKELWAEIQEVSLKFYSGLDDKLLEQLSKVSLPPLSEVRLDFRSLTFLFLEEEITRLDEAIKAALQDVQGKDVYLSRLADFDRLMHAIRQVNAAYNVRNMATSLMAILDVFEHHRTDLAQGYIDEDGNLKHQQWVPLSSVLGTDMVPASVAQVIRLAIEQMVTREDVSPDARWQSLEFWAAESIAGA